MEWKKLFAKMNKKKEKEYESTTYQEEKGSVLLKKVPPLLAPSSTDDDLGVRKLPRKTKSIAKNEQRNSGNENRHFWLCFIPFFLL